MSTNFSQDELRALMLRHLEDGASADEAHRLSAALRESAEARREYVALARQHALLFELAEERKVVVLDKPQFEAKPKPGLRWRPLAWAAAFVVLAGLAVVLFSNRTRKIQSPQIASVRGDVILVGPTGERALIPGERWHSNEALRTAGGNSAVTLKFNDGSQISFGPETTAVNESGSGGRRIKMEHGQVQASIQKQPAQRPFTFATPQAEGIVVGTTLRLIAEDRFTRLEVSEGKVRFRRLSDEAELIVSTGEGATIGPEVPFVARPIGEEPR